MAEPLFKRAEKNADYSDYTRIVILGKTGNGKSATLNSLIGERAFNSGSNSTFVTETCEAVTFELAGRKILLVDTPGIGDIVREENFILNQLKSVMEFTYPGPHAFIICLSVQRFTAEEKYVVNLLSDFFGKQICNYSMVIFTRIDDLEHENSNIREYVDKCTVQDLRDLLFMCKMNYLGVNNRWRSDDPKMIEFKTKFLETLNSIGSTNADHPIYTSAQFETSTKHFELERQKIQQQKLDDQEMKRKMEEMIRFQNEKAIQMENQLNRLHQEMLKKRKKRFCNIQ